MNNNSSDDDKEDLDTSPFGLDNSSFLFQNTLINNADNSLIVTSLPSSTNHEHSSDYLTLKAFLNDMHDWFHHHSKTKIFLQTVYMKIMTATLKILLN